MLNYRLRVGSVTLKIGKTDPVDARRMAACPSAPNETGYVEQKRSVVCQGALPPEWRTCCGWEIAQADEGHEPLFLQRRMASNATLAIGVNIQSLRAICRSRR